MLAVLLEQDHRQQARPGEATAAASHGTAPEAGQSFRQARQENFSRTVLDHLPLSRNNFQRLGDVFAKLRQPVEPQQGPTGVRRDHHTLARQVVGKRLARWPLALEFRLDVVCDLAAACSAASSSCVAEASSSSS